jgi:hypothetical protein
MLTQRSRPPVVALLLVLSLVLVSCSGSETPSASQQSGQASPTDSSSQTSSPSPSSTPINDELTWSAEAFPARIAALATDRGRLVAVGRDKDGLASWTSDGGNNWERHEVADPTFIEGMLDDFGDFGPQLYAGTSMGSMARLGNTLFSIGTFWGPIDFYRPVGWRSADGTTWEFIESKSEYFTYGAVTDVETFGDGLLSARATGLTGPNYGLWRWGAQSSWQETSVKSTNDAILVSLDIASIEDSAMAIGQLAQRTDGPQEDWPTHPVAWMSADGEHWQEGDLPRGLDRVCGVTSMPSVGFTVVGRRDNGELAAWTSADGSDWTKGDLAAPDSQGTCAVNRAGNWLAASETTPGGSNLWLSADGLHWTQQEIPEIHSVNVAELNGTVYVLGAESSDEGFASVLLGGQP